MTNSNNILQENLHNKAHKDAEVWKQHTYYDRAESWIDVQWPDVFEFISGVNFSSVVDLACGHGRNTRRLLEYADKIVCMDINIENIDFCAERFAGEDRVSVMQNDGTSFKPLQDESVSLVYCFDAMVHFDVDVVRAYISDLTRVLMPGGHAFFHHSNYDDNPGGNHQFNPHWRNFMSKNLFAHFSIIEGLQVVRQKIIGWGKRDNFVPCLDCFTLLRKS